jgi:transposase
MPDDDRASAHLAAAPAEVARLREENRLLREKLDIVIRQLFGKKSERLDPAQLELLLGAEGTGEDGAPGKPGAPALEEAEGDRGRRKRERRPRLPEDLPVVETVLDPAPVKACPSAWRRIGQEVSEQLDYQPGRFRKLRTVRPRYVSLADREAPPVIAELPARLVDSGIATPGLVTQVVVAKYCDHLPLYRQEKIYASRHGVKLPRQTMCRWVEAAADWLKPVYLEMKKGLFAPGGYIEVDETPIRYLAPGTGKTAQGYLWTYLRPDGPGRDGGGDVLYDWHPGRGHGCLERFVPEGYEGTFGCDAYSAYPAFAGLRDGAVTLAGCWAHARRKIYEAGEIAGAGTAAKARCAWLLRQIQALYRIEGRLRESRAGPALRHAVRRAESRPLIARIERAIDLLTITPKNKILPKSHLGKALAYARGQRAELRVYLEDGLVEIDNNLVENAIRPTKLGAKNWLFIGSEEAGWRGAVIYSLIESCRRRGIDPYAYLEAVLTRLPEATNWEVPELTPAAWAAAQKNRAKLEAAS